MKILNFLSILFFIVFLTFSCKREKKEFLLEVSGTVTDEMQEVIVPGANIRLDVQEISTSGVFSSAYKKMAETKTDANGKFKIIFNQGEAVNYRITAVKEGYFTRQYDFDSNQLRPDNPYDAVYKIPPRAEIEIKVKNVSPADDFDSIVLNGLPMNYNCDCCKRVTYTFTGTNIDTSFTCSLYGHSNYKLFWEVRKSTRPDNEVFDTNIYCPPFEKTVFSIDY